MDCTLSITIRVEEEVDIMKWMKVVAQLLIVCVLVVGCLCMGTACAEMTEAREIKINNEYSRMLGYNPGMECVVKTTPGTEHPIVLIAIDGTLWAPGRSIANQPCMADQDMMFVRCDSGMETESLIYCTRSEAYAKMVVEQLKESFPNTETLILYAYSKGGWYLNDLYKEVKAQGYEVAFVWCNDACPAYKFYWKGGKLPNGLGYPAVEEDHVPIYIAYSTKAAGVKPGQGTINGSTYDYGHDLKPDNVVFVKEYVCPHNQLGAHSAEDLATAVASFKNDYFKTKDGMYAKH